MSPILKPQFASGCALSSCHQELLVDMWNTGQMSDPVMQMLLDANWHGPEPRLQSAFIHLSWSLVFIITAVTDKGLFSRNTCTSVWHKAYRGNGKYNPQDRDTILITFFLSVLSSQHLYMEHMWMVNRLKNWPYMGFVDRCNMSTLSCPMNSGTRSSVPSVMLQISSFEFISSCYLTISHIKVDRMWLLNLNSSFQICRHYYYTLLVPTCLMICKNSVKILSSYFKIHP